MCGILGTTKGKESAVRDALATFAYRGPDATGYFADACLSLGHARLSIIDLNERSDQPFFTADGELGIVFNGEIYNYQELRNLLQKERGVRFRTASDTEVLIEGYRVWGDALLPKLRGMFAFAIYDRRSNSVFLARDHAGIKPLYYSLEGNQLSFASELKGIVHLLRQNGSAVSIDAGSLHSYPVFGYIPSPHTMVHGVKKLERSSWLRYDLTGHTATYGTWKPRTKEISTTDELKEAVRQSILEHCIADVPVGSFFSGGVDSSLITAVLHAAGKDIQTFSIRVEGRPADHKYFDAIASHLGVKAAVADFGTAEFEDLYEMIFSRMDDPIADTSIFPTSFVAQLASKEVKVVLSGEGGDELFLGYPRIERLAEMSRGGAFASTAFARAFLSAPSFRGKNKLFSEFASRAGIPSAYYLLQVSAARDRSPHQPWIDAQRALAQDDPIWFDRDWYLENMLLRKTDMATSYASIEGRVPFLGAELWNVAPRFAAENLKDGRTKALLKDMLAEHIPVELIERPKAGFGANISAVLRESALLQADLDRALACAHEMGFADRVQDKRLIIERYPVYAFGLVALYRSLINLELI